MKNEILIPLSILIGMFAAGGKEEKLLSESSGTIYGVHFLNVQDDSGKKIFKKYCASCHQVDGSGVPNLTPPLSGTSYVLGDKAKLIRIILNGLNTDVEIDGEHFNNPMPPFKKLKDNQIADVLTFIRSNFGNKAEGINAGEVKSVRQAKD